MKIKWLGHASFLITSDTGTRIITDPYTTTDTIRYGEINEPADIVTVSHGHGDHSNTDVIRGNPEVVRETTDIKGIKFNGIPAFHDDATGTKRGNNTIFCFEVNGVKVCHLGDLGHQLSDKQVADLGKVDILLMQVVGSYTIDAASAGKIVTQVKPNVIIPMHIQNSKCALPIAGVDKFLQGKEDVHQLNTSEVEFKAGELPSKTEIIVLKPAL